MANEEGKQLKITVAVDNAAMEQFKRAIREVTSEVSKLVAQLNSAGNMLGNKGVALSSRSGFNANTGATPGMQKPVGGALTAPAEAVMSGMRAQARGSVDALRQMETATRSSLTRSAQDLKMFERALEGVANKYKDLQGVSAGGGAIPGMSLPQASPFAPSGVTNRSGVDYAKTTPGLWAKLNAPIGGEDGISAIGRGRALYGVGAGYAAYGASAIYDRIVSTGRSMATGGAEYNQFEQMAGQRNRAGVNQVFGGMSEDIRTNLVARMALNQLRQQGNAPANVASIKSQMKVAAGNIQQTGLFAGAASEGFRSLLNGGSWMLPTGINNYNGPGAEWARSTFGNPNVTNQTPTELGVRTAQARNAVPLDISRVTKEMFQNAIDSLNVRERNTMEGFQGSAMGRLSMQHAARTTNAMLLGQGTQFSNEEVGGMRAQLGAQGGGNLMGLASSALNYQAGGIGNAGGIMSQVGQFGAGRAKSFMQSIAGSSSMFGAPGMVDVAATSQIASIIAQEMMNTSHHMPFAAQGLLAATGGLGGNMLAAQNIQRGMGMAGQINAGATSPMQAALNNIAGTRIGGSFYGGQMLQALTPIEELDVMRGGALPRQFEGTGVGADTIRDYVNQRNKTSFFGYRSGKGNNPEETRLVDMVRTGGLSAVAGEITGKTQAERNKSFQDLTYKLGHAQALGRGDFGSAATAAAQAMESIELAKNPEILAAITGGRVGAVGGKPERAEKRRQDQIIKEGEDLLKIMFARDPHLLDKFTPEQLAAIDFMGKVADGNIENAADMAARALQYFANAMRKKNGSSPTKTSAAGNTAKPGTKPSHK